MCCSLGPANLSNTVLYAAQVIVDGELRHVLGYQNKAKNLSGGPNAMILPFPAAAPMGPDNVVDTSACKGILTDYAEAVTPKSRGFKGLRSDDRIGAVFNSRVVVFDSGNYTIVLAEDARAIPAALSRVPEAKRPAINQEIFDAYAKWYPGWPIALCCFDSAVESEPMLWWYKPAEKEFLFTPGLDGHNGRAPDLKATVQVDHTVVMGSGVYPAGIHVDFQDRVPAHVTPYLARLVSGRVYGGSMPNGDFVARVDSHGLVSDTIARVAPPGAL